MFYCRILICFHGICLFLIAGFFYALELLPELNKNLMEVIYIRDACGAGLVVKGVDCKVGEWMKCGAPRWFGHVMRKSKDEGTGCWR